jgi:hypothetical protein
MVKAQSEHNVELLLQGKKKQTFKDDKVFSLRRRLGKPIFRFIQLEKRIVALIEMVA